MKKSCLTLLFFLLILSSGFSLKLFAQYSPVMYFCEKYENGEMGVSSRFVSGPLTIIVKSDYALGLKDVNIHLEKFNCSTSAFEIYKNINFTLTPDKKYVVLADKELSFDTPGIYKSYLFDSSNKVIASAIVEISK